MLCQHCKKNEATYHHVEIIDGKSFESHLCESCRAAFPGGDSGLYGWMFANANRTLKACPVCGTTLADYERSGLLGCASCYDVFKAELIPSIKKMQDISGEVRHVGKVGSNNDEHGLYRRLKYLQERLENALREKNFVEAGRLNKRIDEITKTLYGGGNND